MTKRLFRTVNDLIVKAPWLWPVLKYPTRRFFDGCAHGWDDRTGAPGADHLASLAAGLTHVSPAPERALDVGTGTGTGALLLAREFPQARVRGVDVSEEMIATARSKVGLDPEGRIAFKVGDASTLPWPDDSFDLVVQLNVPPFFDELRRVVRPGGQVVIAASSGDQTPFYTSNRALERGFAKRDIELVEAGGAGSGSFWVGRRKA
jgi:SAM-dependent methyltransferase